MKIIKNFVIWILTVESKLIIRKYKPFIVAVTGSVGKTSTKDAIYAVIKNESRFARKAEKSMNSEIGLPLTIIGVPNAWRSFGGWLDNISAGLKLLLSRRDYPQCLVVEVGADHPNDIKRVTKWLKPDIAVITKISRTPVHVEFFDSPEQVFEEKAYLATAVKKGGTLVLYADDENVLTLRDRVKDKGINILTFGLNAGSDVRGSDDKVLYENEVPAGTTFTIEIDGNNYPLTIRNILGRAQIYPLLAAAAVGKAKGMSAQSTIEALPKYDAPRGRMNILKGIKDSTIIDDSYNSSPDAAISALETLKSLSSKGKKILILGDMMELGSYSSDEHRKIGAAVAGVASRLITVGVRSHATADEAIKKGMLKDSVQSFNTSEEAAVFVAGVVGAGDIVLVKGSQSVRSEKIVKALMNEPQRAGDLLVRQDKEWLADRRN